MTRPASGGAATSGAAVPSSGVAPGSGAEQQHHIQHAGAPAAEPPRWLQLLPALADDNPDDATVTDALLDTVDLPGSSARSWTSLPTCSSTPPGPL